LYSIKFIRTNKHIAQYAYLIFLKEQRSLDENSPDQLKNGGATSSMSGRPMSTMTDSDGKMSCAFSMAAMGNHFYRAFSSAGSRPLTTEDDTDESENESAKGRKESDKARRAHSVNKDKSTPVLDAYEFEGSRPFDHLL
jgi:hypothetical protein